MLTTSHGAFSEGPAELMLRIGESVSFDRNSHGLMCRAARHRQPCWHVGILTEVERAAIRAGLDTILAEIEAGTFEWNRALEDVRMNIEQADRAGAGGNQVARPAAATIRWQPTYGCSSARLDRLNAALGRDCGAGGLPSAAGPRSFPATRICSGSRYRWHTTCWPCEMFDTTDRVAAVQEQANVCPLG